MFSTGKTVDSEIRFTDVIVALDVTEVLEGHTGNV